MVEYKLNNNAIQDLCEKLIKQDNLKIKSFKVKYWDNFESVGERMCCRSNFRKIFFYKSYKGQIIVPEYFREDGSFERMSTYLLEHMGYDIYQYAKDAGIQPEEALIMFFIFHEYGHLMMNSNEVQEYGTFKTSRDEKTTRSRIERLNLILIMNMMHPNAEEEKAQEKFEEECKKLILAYRFLPSEMHADKTGIMMLEKFKENGQIKQMVKNIMMEVE